MPPRPFRWNRFDSAVRRAVARAQLPEQGREDVVQEVLLRAARAAQRGDAPRSVSGFVRLVLRQVLVDRWRGSDRSEPLEVDVPDAAEDPLGEAERTEWRARLRRVVGELPTVQREAVTLRFFEHLAFEEIARRQGVPVATAISRVHRALARLRTRLEDGDA